MNNRHIENLLKQVPTIFVVQCRDEAKMKLLKKTKTDRCAKNIVSCRNRKFILKIIRQIAQRSAQKYAYMQEE